MKGYRHRQFGSFLVTAMVLIALGVWAIAAWAEPAWVPVLVSAILLVVAWVFSSLIIEITPTHLCWKFGPGLIRKRVPLEDIADCEVTRTRAWEGWGVRLTRRGWLYNVSGLDAVLVRRKSGKQFLLGSDEPARLASALRASL